MRYRRTARFVALFSLLAGGSSGIAREALSESDYLGELPVVLSATRLRQPLSETPAAMTVIDRQMIRDSGAWDVADVFRLVPGMTVAYNVDKEVVPGHVVSYHGMADPYAKRMQILVDGRSVYTPMFGGPIWSNIPLALDDIERIEVVRGPSAATYGANSFLGVINIITRDPAESRGAMLSVAGGKPGADATLRYGGGTENVDYRLTLQWRDDRGYTINPERLPSSAPGTGAVNPRNDDKAIRNLSLRTAWHLTNTDDLQFHFGFSGGSRESGDQNNRFVPFHEKTVSSQYEMLQWQHSFSADNQLSVRLFHNRDTLEQSLSGLIGTTTFGPFTLGAPSPFDQPMEHMAERYDAEIQHTFSVADSIRVVWGGGARRDHVRSPLYFNRPDGVKFDQRNFFGNMEWRPHAAWVFNLGAMLEDNNFVGMHLSPRGGVNFHVWPGHTLRAALGRAYRNPVAHEQQGNSHWVFPNLTAPALPVPLQYLYGRDNLRPERIDSRELGYLFELGSGGALDLKYSRDRVTDLIEMYGFTCTPAMMTLPQCVGTTAGQAVRIFDNRSEVTVDAFEFQWQQKLGERTQVHAGWASTRIIDDKTLATGNAVVAYDRSAPRHSWNMLVAHDFFERWRGSLAGYYVNGMKAIGGDSLPAYTRWDARLAYRFRVAGTNGEMAVIGQNLLGSDIREFYADNVYGRRLWANLRLDF